MTGAIPPSALFSTSPPAPMCGVKATSRWTAPTFEGCGGPVGYPAVAVVDTPHGILIYHPACRPDGAQPGGFTFGYEAERRAERTVVG